MFDSVTEAQFVANMGNHPLDAFAKRFRAKANTQSLWPCVGLWRGGALAGAIAWTVSKRRPHVANLQLLHVFHQYRRAGVATALCERFLAAVKEQGAEYFRVSSEPDAVQFYRSLGITFLGKQKSGCLLAMAKLHGNTFAQCRYDLTDPTIARAVNSKAKGGCVDVFQ